MQHCFISAMLDVFKTQRCKQSVSHIGKMSDPIIERLHSHKRYNRHWVIGKPYSYGGLWYKDQRTYYGKLEREWSNHVDQSNAFIKDLRTLNCLRVQRHSLTMAHCNIVEYAVAILQIREDNNHMLIQKARYYILNVSTTNIEDNNRILSEIEVNYHHMMLGYSYDFHMSNNEPE